MARYSIIIPGEYSEERVDALLQCLPEWRREEALRFKHRQGQRECTLSYHLLCQMVDGQPEFVRGEHGKPSVTSPGLQFNLSHCKTAIGCVVSELSPVGIDVECLGRYREALARYCMNDDELRQIAESGDPDAVFTLLWTKKEALLKLTGEGITDDMKNCLQSDRMRGVTIESGYDKEKGYAYSIAHADDDVAVRVVQ